MTMRQIVLYLHGYIENLREKGMDVTMLENAEKLIRDFLNIQRPGYLEKD
jgi:hypothetical protein